MIGALLPDAVEVVATGEELVEVALHASELESLGQPVEKRRREFVTVRACAREALARLGHPDAAVPNGAAGEPLWPEGIVGSMTHCRGYRACAVARVADLHSVGIDAEVDEPLPDGVWEQVAFGPERELRRRHGGELNVDRLLFSAKEAVYKAWYPLAEAWLGFEDARLDVDVERRSFRARLLVTGPMVDGRRLQSFDGRWTVRDGIIATAISVPAGLPTPGRPPAPHARRA